MSDSNHNQSGSNAQVNYSHPEANVNARYDAQTSREYEQSPYGHHQQQHQHLQDHQAFHQYHLNKQNRQDHQGQQGHQDHQDHHQHHSNNQNYRDHETHHRQQQRQPPHQHHPPGDVDDSDKSNAQLFTEGTFSSTTYSSTSASNPSGTQRYTEQSRSNDREGTTTRHTYEETGRPPLEEVSRVAPSGKVSVQELDRVDQIESGQAEADRLYQERIEDEYARREGGA